MDQKNKNKNHNNKLVSNSKRPNHLRNEIVVITYLRGEQILTVRKKENSQEK